MNKIRYKQRDCKNQDKIEELLTTTRIGIVGMSDNDSPYIVPVNFVWHKGAIYFHGMGSGRKDDILSQKPKVTFIVYHEYGTVTDPVPCKADTSYISVMIFGKTQKIVDFKDAAEVLQKILDKYTPNFYAGKLPASMIEKYRSSHDNKRVAVYKIEVEELTAKENAAEPEQLFKT